MRIIDELQDINERLAAPIMRLGRDTMSVAGPFMVRLEGYGPREVPCIKALRQMIPNISLGDAKNAVVGVPTFVGPFGTVIAANALVAAYREAGGSAAVIRAIAPHL